MNHWLRNIFYSGVDAVAGRAGHKGMVILVDQGVASSTNFITGVILARALTKSDFGLYTLGFSIILFLTAIQRSIISTPYTIYSPRVKGEGYFRYNGSVIFHQISFSGIAALGLLLGAGAIAFDIQLISFSRIVLVLSSVITFILLREYIRQFCFANFDVMIAFLLDMCVALFQICGLFLAAKFGMLTVSHSFLIIGVACGLPGITWVFRYRSKFIISIKQAIYDLRSNWNLGKWTFAGAIAGTISGELYPWLLAGLYDSGATAVLAACRGLVFMTNPFFMGLGHFLGPKTAHLVAQKRVGELENIIYWYTIIIFVLMGIFCLIVLFLGENLLYIFYGGKYTGHGKILTLLALGQLISFLSLPLSCGLIAMERADIVFKSFLLGMLNTFIIGIIMVKYYGITGAAIALVSTSSVVATYRWWGYRNISRRSRKFKSLRVGNKKWGEEI